MNCNLFPKIGDSICTGGLSGRLVSESLRQTLQAGVGPPRGQENFRDSPHSGPKLWPHCLQTGWVTIPAPGGVVSSTFLLLVVRWGFPSPTVPRDFAMLGQSGCSCRVASLRAELEVLRVLTKAVAMPRELWLFLEWET